MSGISDNPSIRLKELAEPVNDFLEKSGMTFSTMVRTALKNYMLAHKNKTPDTRLPEEIKNLRLDLAKVGSNLNQIAYNLNLDFPVSDKHIKETHLKLQKEFKTIIDLLKKIENEFKL